MKKVCTLIACIVSFVSFADAQKKYNSHRKQGADRRWAIFINLLSVAEPYQAAIGGGINYKISARWDVNAEYNYVYKGSTQAHEDYNPKGFRAIVTVKRFSKSRIFFYGIDLRVKHFSFPRSEDFINSSTSDTLQDFRHRLGNTLPGIAGIAGIRLPLTRKKKLAFEFNAGIGYKYRFVNRKTVPAGYDYFQGYNGLAEFDFKDDQEVQHSTFYLPVAVRFYYFFSK